MSGNLRARIKMVLGGSCMIFVQLLSGQSGKLIELLGIAGRRSYPNADRTGCMEHELRKREAREAKTHAFHILQLLMHHLSNVEVKDACT